MKKKETFSQHYLDRPVFHRCSFFTIEKAIFILILLLTVLSRFLFIGERGMSHDEVNHVVPSYSLYSGRGYTHDPVTHGPFQFHILALTYFMFGDNDYTSRIPAALFSTAAVFFVMMGFRRYLGRTGSLVGGLIFLISPLLLFYGRYTRNEAFIELFAVLTFYGVLRYLEKRDNFSLYLLAVVTAMQFVTKEVSYIYTAQLLLFGGILFLIELWETFANRKSTRRKGTAILLTAALLLLTGTGLLLSGAETLLTAGGAVLAVLGVLATVFFLAFLLRQTGWQELRRLPAFNLIVFIGALILPQLTAFPVKLLGWDPLDYSSAGMMRTGIVLALLLIISFLIGIWWNRKVFLNAAAAFYLIFITFYTTLFSNGHGLFTGILGSLGYWLSQHEVQRGGQPLYYYGLVLLPVYEFAAIAGTLIAIVFAARHRRFWQHPSDSLSASPADFVSEGTSVLGNATDLTSPKSSPEIVPDALTTVEDFSITAEENPESIDSRMDLLSAPDDGRLPVILLFLYWTLTALIAYSIAGEKMPWLAVHITLPLSLSAAWGIGWLIKTFPWQQFCTKSGWLGLFSLFTGSISAAGIVRSLRGPGLPFAGMDPSQLKLTSQFLLAAIVFLISLTILVNAWRKWSGLSILKTITMVTLCILLLLQARTAYFSSFVNYDYANELLVYAHGAPGPKIALQQIEEIAALTGQGKSIKVAFDNDARYPYWWYFRDYPNRLDFDETITRNLRNYDIIIANTNKEDRLKPVVRDDYFRYEYIRLWWPNQDYFNLTAGRVMNALADPTMRSALFDIWLNRDYTQYAQVTGKNNLTLETWEPAFRMVVYIRKSLPQRIWSLGNLSVLAENLSEDETLFEDEKFVELNPVLTISTTGSETGQLNAPRGVAVASDGRIYVLDSGNNRVQYFSAEGEYLGMWDAAEQGGLSQPWGIAAGPDNTIYIADTWNHRILKFSQEGQFLAVWRANDPSEPGKAFYGPRSVAVDSNGRVFVSDTGNKRVMVYTSEGELIGKFGRVGVGEGELDEPVGIAISNDKQLAVADTWNQRVQIFDISAADPSAFQVVHTFEVPAWYSQSLDNKPYIAFTEAGDILITDPEGNLVWQFMVDGKLIRSWNGGGGNIDRPSMPCGITVDNDGSVWVVNTTASQVNKFVLP